MRVDYDSFLTEIRRFVANQDSGFIRVLRGSGQRVITIGVMEGEIVAVSYGTTRGQPALDKIRELESGTLHVQRTKFRSVDTDLPSTQAILSLLDGAGDLVPSSGASGVAGRFIDKTSIADRVLPLLRQYIGPMADFVWDDELATLSDPLPSTEVQAFISVLGDNIKDPRKRKHFVEEALKVLPGDAR